MLEPAPPKGFVASHRIVLTFFGAAIAIGTFLLKDVAQESLKKKLESQQSVESAAVLRRDTLDGENAALGSNPPADANAMRRWSDGKLRLLDHAQDNLMNLMAVLPDDKDEHLRFRQLLDATKPLVMPGADPTVAASQAESLYVKTNAALTLVRLRADDVRRTEERRLALVTYAVYGLIVAGIFIAALGQVYKR